MIVNISYLPIFRNCNRINWWYVEPNGRANCKPFSNRRQSDNKPLKSTAPSPVSSSNFPFILPNASILNSLLLIPLSYLIKLFHKNMYCSITSSRCINKTCCLTNAFLFSKQFYNSLYVGVCVCIYIYIFISYPIV